MVSYVAIYTPLKQITPFAVFVGAFPGAIPPMLGWIAFTGEMSLQAIILFAIYLAIPSFLGTSLDVGR